MQAPVDVVDSHLHLWDPGRLHYPWLDREPRLRRAFLPTDLDADGVTVEGVVAVQADCAPAESTDEVHWLQRCAQTWPVLHAVVAHAAVETGARCRAALDALSGENLVVGVRRLLQDEPPGFAVAPAFIDGVRLVGHYGLTFDLCVRQHQLREVAELVRRCPDVTFVLDHLGKPRVASRPRPEWVGDLAALGALPNVRCKLSGLATEAIDASPDPVSFRPYLRHAVDVFGPTRCLFGSDWPVSSTAIGYPAWLAAVRDAIDDLPADDQEAVLSGTARLVYRLPTWPDESYVPGADVETRTSPC